MTLLSEKDLLGTLAKWIKLQKSPYIEDRSIESSFITLAPPSCPGSRLEICLKENGQMQFSFVHPLFRFDQLKSTRAIRKESQQFNSLMEQVKLPTYVWENTTEERFELRWEECMSGITEMSVLTSIFHQSLFLSNALSAQLGWEAMHEHSRALH